MNSTITLTLRNSKFLLVLSVLLIGNILNVTLASTQDTLSKYILTPKPGLAPQINGPKVFGVHPGNPILFTIPTSGVRPITFTATNLPKGVKLDPASGRLSGVITKPGEYKITLQAKNKIGVASRSFNICVGETLALTPPMGWNSWNIYASQVTQELVLANAKVMANSGLIDHGWSFMNIADVNPHGVVMLTLRKTK